MRLKITRVCASLREEVHPHLAQLLTGKPSLFKVALPTKLQIKLALPLLCENSLITLPNLGVKAAFTARECTMVKRGLYVLVGSPHLSLAASTMLRLKKAGNRRE